MAERKIFNFESIVLVDRTFEEYGYYPDKYGETSAKFIVAICRYCGKESHIRKGFFNKSGSACHKACRVEEQKKNSPFKDKDVQKKVQKIINDKYGFDRKEIGKKISESNKTEESLNKRRKTCLKKYGVKNVFQSEEIKERIKKTNLEKYGFEDRKSVV